MENRKLAHLHLSDTLENTYTLICRLKDGSIKYTLFGGWNSSGTPFSITNLQCTLPICPLENETEEKFVERIINIINNESVKYVVGKVPVKIEFA